MSFLEQAAVTIEGDIDILEVCLQLGACLTTLTQIYGNAMKSCVNYTKRQGLKN